MLVDLSVLADSEEKIIQREIPYGPAVFSSVMGDFPILEKSPVFLSVQKQEDGKLQIAGRMDFIAEIPCSRCLEEVSVPITVEFEKELDIKADTPSDKAEEQFFLKGLSLDVDALVTSEIFTVWPMKVLCREDCKGLCSKCGANLNLQTCNCDTAASDPRMAKIRDIFNEYKEV